MKHLLTGTLCFLLLAPTVLGAEKPEAEAQAKKPASTVLATDPPAAAPQAQQPTSVRPNSTVQQRRSYEREVRPRPKRQISKSEIIFMAGIAGTSMGIGALAGGGTGLAIGAIVGGWGAYAGHRIWHWVSR